MHRLEHMPQLCEERCVRLQVLVRVKLDRVRARAKIGARVGDGDGFSV